ncbi:hypothetical protein B9Q13_00635 [Candidatus Marsarchaeota G2 archaeon ECH_B_SAG-G16]|uniref:Glycerate kinase n=4 Tax=Candidatus Marsarchaeota TaxID=1978152 RepID=A0A2R6AAX8_9ARCH|nr:MAG: hypothetical protein B9Q01_04250 [Candidatus Marsarchaeota G1 archaeon OSP_D]PSN89267.1 MAG: hypothetical protein B9Q00_01915 [Candidatus Marsarchaeota G1 archaeon OSP_C]PSN94386.1 MAG: hypothetical protein B9P99_01715 [Candidatus Marsarchaeota G1 archaeon OSP_B]PSO05859.1 MAG: hypothetical protein B9Q13_00635 [Candidatus Marsarchaeota G2 archaeon ECH_B_SAG-G16]
MCELKRLLIKNLENLLETQDATLRELRRDCLEAIQVGIRAVTPSSLFRKLRISGSSLIFGEKKLDLKSFSKIYVIGAGKASLGMVKALNKLIGEWISEGEVLSNEIRKTRKLGKITLNPATHPLPSALSIKATERVLSLISKRKEEDLFVVLLSGGASSMLVKPRPPLTLKEKSALVKRLLKAGATIEELNAVRKHMSTVKGGFLQRLIYPATSLTLVISDVVGDRLDVIGSGPTYPDVSTFSDALRVLKKYGIKPSEKLLNYFERGVNGEIAETPKPQDECFKSAYYFLLGSVKDACKATKNFLEKRGRRTLFLTDMMKGEAREVGKLIAGIALSDKNYFECFVLGGETTVNVRGRGRGGRNQELCLSALLEIKQNKRVVIASVGTDGIDGTTNAAGAIVDCEVYRKALSLGLDPASHLLENDSGSFFKRTRFQILTGKTGTNVSDLVVVVRSL